MEEDKIEKTEEVVVDGVVYEAIPSDKYSCNGCAAINNNRLCESLKDKINCYKPDRIFVKKRTVVNKYTVQEIRKAIVDCYGENLVSLLLTEGKLQQLLDKVTDPEYDTYLKIKDKFK